MFGAGLAINAVTNDAVDPDSLQPELKACAVALTRVGAAPRASDLAGALGLPDRPEPPVLDSLARQYLLGLITGLDSPGAAPGCPPCPPDAPLDAAARAWVNGRAGRHVLTDRRRARKRLRRQRITRPWRCCGRRRPAPWRTSSPPSRSRSAKAGIAVRARSLDSASCRR